MWWDGECGDGISVVCFVFASLFYMLSNGNYWIHSENHDEISSAILSGMKFSIDY